MRHLVWALVVLCLSLATPAAAQVYIGQAGTGVSPGAGWASDDFAGQIFTVPAGVTRLDEFSLGMTGTGSFILGIVPESQAATTNFIAVSGAMSVNLPTTQYQMQTFRPFSGVTVVPGETYLLRRVILSGDPQVLNSGADYYADGEFWVDGIWGMADDTFFRVGFDLPPPVVPTLSEWGLMLLGLGLAALALGIVRRRHAA